jgi:hypothetical protein
MSDFNSVPFPDQNSTHRAREEDQDWKNNTCAYLDVRHVKVNEGDPGTKRKLHSLAQDFHTRDEQDDDERRDSKRKFYSNETPTLLQERSTSVQSKDICDECRGLNLDVMIREVQGDFFYYTQKQFTAPWEYDRIGRFGLRARVGYQYRRQQFACALCRALVASRITPETNSGTAGTAIQDDREEIWVQYYYNRDMDMMIRGFEGVRRRAVRLFLVPQGSAMESEVFRDRIKLSGSLILLETSTDPKMFDPQPISPSFDSNLVLSWIDYCTRYHRLLCRSVPMPVHGVKVIDCTTLEIKDYNASTPYVSLSYVWGKSNDACRPVETIGARKTLPQLVSPVIRDSIEVTKALGYNYLWIDKFCIDQDAAELKHDQIQQMDAIYQNSQLTIVSAAGQDESFGLPGVGARGRRHQFAAKLDGARVFWNPIDPHEAIARSHWSTRGWTFQEALLSRRRLVFTEDQVYFQCSTMNCFESHHCALDKLHVKNKSKTLETIRAGAFGQSKYQTHGKLVRGKESLAESFGRYLSHVEDYTTRNLSFDQDSLNAFQGIIRQFSHEKYAFNHVWGLAYPTNCKENLVLFVRSLTWVHRAASKVRRRSQFPSWTWAGWAGHIEYKISRGRKLWFDNGLHDVRFRSTADGLRALEELGEDGNHAALTITATVVSLDPWSYRYVGEVRTPWCIVNRDASLSWSESGHTDAELAEMIKDTSRWQLVYIGSILKASFVMVLGSCNSGVTWRRSGMFTVDCFHFDIKPLIGKQICTFDLE